MLTPVEIESIKFRRTYRGYNIKEVLTFKEQIQEDFEKLYKDNKEMSAKIDELNKKLANYQVMEENLRNAVILAQKTADEVKISAQSQADIMIREAVQQGEQVKGRIREEIQTELQNLAVLKNQVQLFKSQFKSYLTSLIEIADRQIDMSDIWDSFQKAAPQVNLNSKVTAAAVTAETPAGAEAAATTEANEVKADAAEKEAENSAARNGGAFGSPDAFLNMNKDWES